MPLLIKNGLVVNADSQRRADVYAEDQMVSRIETTIDPAELPRGTEVIDATERLVFPGFIDPHVHIHLPFMGTNAIDDHDSATRAALAGGTTTIIEMICPGPDDEPRAAFDTWKGLAEDGANCDYSFHLSVVRFDELADRQIRELVADHGVASFKIFLAYKGALDIADSNLIPLLELARELGVIVTAHCENAEAIDAMQRRLLADGKTGPEWHEPSRPRSVEASGVNHLCTFAELTGAHIYIVHTSCKAALDQAIAARARGVNVWVESVAPHLVLDHSYAERPGFEGAKFVMSPPLRDAEEHGPLWSGIADRSIATIGTDHAPFNFGDQKSMGRAAFTAIPNGIPSVQERIDLVHTHGVDTGRIDLQTMVDACSTQAAKIFGLYPRKGVIAVGSDADLVVYDPSFEGTFDVADSLSKTDYSGYQGMRRKGRAEVVVLRGRIAARDGVFVGAAGGGRYLGRAPSH
ncbi:MAG: dihydropyrimidinase [Phycisphaerales bacterium]|jgi:dihydropyrimidinase|nr:dihydropyrimidinase [Phycisphaerales bacterium]